MKVTRPLSLVAAGLLSATALAACSADSGTSDATTAELDARVTSLEEQVRGLESIIGRVIIADPAAQMQQLEAEVSALANDLADAEAWKRQLGRAGHAGKLGESVHAHVW